MLDIDVGSVVELNKKLLTAYNKFGFVYKKYLNLTLNNVPTYLITYLIDKHDEDKYGCANTYYTYIDGTDGFEIVNVYSTDDFYFYSDNSSDEYTIEKCYTLDTNSLLISKCIVKSTKDGSEYIVESLDQSNYVIDLAPDPKPTFNMKSTLLIDKKLINDIYDSLGE